MSGSSTGQQDRRGIEDAIYIGIALGVLSVICFLFVSWILGIIFLSLCVIVGIVWEASTRLPINNPNAFLKCFREMTPPRPVLVCIGDSLTHGRVSADWTTLIPPKISTKMQWDPPKKAPFTDPLWVVNCGQNSICSHTILQERLPFSLACYPDFVCIMIGSNDCISTYFGGSVANGYVNKWKLPEVPSMAGLKRNINGIVDFIIQSSIKTQIGLCTLPPLGENLNHPANQIIKQANEIIRSVAEAHSERCSIIPINERLCDAIVQRNNGGKNASSIDKFTLLASIMVPLYHLFGISWKTLAGTLGGNCVLFDTLHFNEDGADIVADTVVEWLFRKNVHKAIAVKQF